MFAEDNFIGRTYDQPSAVLAQVQSHPEAFSYEGLTTYNLIIICFLLKSTYLGKVSGKFVISKKVTGLQVPPAILWRAPTRSGAHLDNVQRNSRLSVNNGYKVFRREL